MTRCWAIWGPSGVCVCLSIFLSLSFGAFDRSSNALTMSTGEPFSGKLADGVRFPANMKGFKLLDEKSSYTTPEVVGALLEAVEKFQTIHPGTCDLCMGDFSKRGGGRLKGHESHQNGRDVDVGLFARDNRQLDRFVPMTGRMLDPEKTWDLIQSLLSTEDVEHIFLDRSIQVQLYRHALSRGADPRYLAGIFQYPHGRKDAVIEHIPGHRNHMHVRFYAPWSTLAGKYRDVEPGRMLVLETAQWYDPQKPADPHAGPSELNPSGIARNVELTYEELCRQGPFPGAGSARTAESLASFSPLPGAETLRAAPGFSPLPKQAFSNVLSGSMHDFVEENAGANAH